MIAKPISIFHKIWSFKDHGKDFDSVFNGQSCNKFKWLHSNLGSNFRLTEMQSAIGLLQLTKLHSWNQARTNNASILTSYLDDLPVVRVPHVPPYLRHAWYKYYCYLVPERLNPNYSRQHIIDLINSLGYPAFSGSCSEIYLEKAFIDKGLSPVERLPNAKSLGDLSLMFLVHPTISSEVMHQYARDVSQVLKSVSL